MHDRFVVYRKKRERKGVWKMMNWRDDDKWANRDKRGRTSGRITRRLQMQRTGSHRRPHPPVGHGKKTWKEPWGPRQQRLLDRRRWPRRKEDGRHKTNTEREVLPWRQKQGAPIIGTEARLQRYLESIHRTAEIQGCLWAGSRRDPKYLWSLRTNMRSYRETGESSHANNAQRDGVLTLQHKICDM